MFYTSSSSSSSEPLSSLSERGATSYLQRSKIFRKMLKDTYAFKFYSLFQIIGNNCVKMSPAKVPICRHDTDPGFISSQASSWPAFGASTPVRIFPLSTWMTFTGRSLIWLVSSKGWERRGCQKKPQNINTVIP